jgi:hypothetical protein
MNTDDAEFGGLFHGVGGGVDSLATHLAEAWLVLSEAERGDGRSTRHMPEIPGYVSEDWAKMVARRLQGYARLHLRPQYWPWTEREFDQFSWRSETL